MEITEKKTITIQTAVKAPVQKVWQHWTAPESIVRWNNASVDWHTTRAENDLRAGGKFLARMEAKDGSYGFDFEGVYDEIIPHEKIQYTIGDGRKVTIVFMAENNLTRIVESFEAENINSIELQQNGWQSILDNFKKFTESNI